MPLAFLPLGDNSKGLLIKKLSSKWVVTEGRRVGGWAKWVKGSRRYRLPVPGAKRHSIGHVVSGIVIGLSGG